MEYTVEDYVNFIKQGRRDKISPKALDMIAEKFDEYKKLLEIDNQEIGKAADEAYKGSDGLCEAYGTVGFERGVKWLIKKMKNI